MTTLSTSGSPATALVTELQERGQLPTLDGNVSDICSLTGDPLSCAADLTAVIVRDSSLTAAVIAAANSALYRRSEAIKTVSGAILLLGFETVRDLALGMGILKVVGQSSGSQALYRLFAGAYFSGVLARGLALEEEGLNAEEFMVAGVLAQLPRLLLAHAFPDRYAQMEQRIVRDHLPQSQACEEVFGVDFGAVAVEVARRWNIPNSVARWLTRSVERDPVACLVHQGGRLADMMFGNLPGGSAALAAVERELRDRFDDPEFELSRFIGDTCGEDPNVARFFRLSAQDIEMMVKIVEWGKVNPATVSACLSAGAGGAAFAAAAAEDPGIVIGQCLTELTMAIRKGADINRVLLTSLEAISRCLKPACAILAFVDAGRTSLVGRLFLSASARGRATDFRVDLEEQGSPFLRAITTKETVVVSARREGVAGALRTWNADATLAVPVVVFGKVIGLCVVGREMGLAYSAQEREWVDAVIGQVSLAFERSR